MERCPSCNAPVSSNSKFCNECGYGLIQSSTSNVPSDTTKRSYKLRSPILESAILYDDTTEKKHGMLVILSYSFWFFAVIFIIYGIMLIYKNYTIDIFKSVVDASMLFALSFVCFILPGIINILVDIEENLKVLVKESRKDKID
ncbi:MAG: zinc ribbon domain-containing protein [Cyanobacteriota bacterium]